ncbi:excinuclease ABC, A subunit [Emticicia oligotrophica DSM 17448]|uniref:UvrABC system protein A n=1 Tax=Emticicia oligotrophica (strain DSM 17448 / CIP 109782 / MTCC 6937 / GPTSA100-15) TaxID=929562 RepID=A0ABN4AKE5_EMTOG|nr:excinuclease ABC subunit UvrA [Emticicia oligotrophica]AFK02508.1 excinuclease ABC, A subunit [Emticicia oligotrophica DSM 17448]
MNNTPNTQYTNVESLDPKQHIIIKGAKVNNLKNIDVAIPRNKLVVVTGLSGSGKSSLAFDTLFAEGQRMYVESLSSYARQFLGRMEKPEVDYIKGVSPAIAIEQKVATKNPRSTVGTTTEIYDYLKLLFARAGITYSPVSGQEVRKDTVTDVVNFILSHEEGTRVMVLTPLKVKEGRKIEKELELLLQKGYTRIVVDGEIKQIEELQETKTKLSTEQDLEILIDRGIVKLDDEDTQFRFSDSVQTAFFEGEGECIVEIVPSTSLGQQSTSLGQQSTSIEQQMPKQSMPERGSRGPKRSKFSDKFELDGIAFEEPSVNLFTFNNPYGACKRCEGYGKVLGIDPELVIPDKNLSVFEGAIAPWRTERMSEWLTPLLRNGIRFDFPIHRSYKDLSPEEQKLLWTGNAYFQGLDAFFADIESQVHKVQYRVMLSRYRGRTDCPDCRGSRLRKDASYVKIGGKSIVDLVLMSISEVAEFFKNLELPEYQKAVSKRILIEINSRLEFMERVGLGYLTLNRLASTLSGGEFQRIKLATSLGSSLVGSMYILDEPSIGLHPRDTKRLVSVLESLRDMGNTVVVVEHEEEVMRAADQIIDIGPNAGTLGGELVFQGSWEEINQTATNQASISHTINFLTGIDQISTPTQRRRPTDFIELKGARENNLKEVDVKFPLGVLTVVTGVSGSGKSTLVRKILFPAIARLKGEYSEEAGKYAGLVGSLDRITQVEMIDQNPIGKSSRSNPVTYIKAYDYIRQMMAEQQLSKARDYKPAFFSFNVDGGRCEACQGEGEQTIEMQFMADVRLKCESCGGKRFKQEILEVKYNEKDIADILAMTVDEAIEFFSTSEPKLADKLRPLQDVGLGYIRLGQSSSTLSGGEAQRVKLAFFLSKGNADKGKTLFVFDEPTTGLHFHDIKKLLKAINALVDQGDTVIIIEHNMEVIKSADWIIDLGPEGGEKGGYLTFEGTPEEMVKLEGNYTADFLKGKV